jgi:predicted SprT family Zn-dependent metalloprotease
MDLPSAFTLARRLMDAHGLSRWELAADRAKTRAGSCRHADCLITLSLELMSLYDEDEVRETVLHEIAHALVGLEHHHDEVWRATARSLGCSGRRCVSVDAPRSEARWSAECPAGHRTLGHARPSRVKACKRCCNGLFSPEHVLTWTVPGSHVRMLPQYVAELVRLRDKYGDAEPLIRQLETDRLLGGGEQHPSVQAHLDVRLTPGTAVRFLHPRTGAVVKGVVVRKERSRFRVKVGENIFRCPPAALSVEDEHH